MLQHNPTTLPYVAAQYLKALKVPCDAALLKRQIEQSPWYPSLYSLDTVFKRNRINCLALEVNVEEAKELDLPFVGYLKNQAAGKDFVLVKGIGAESVLINTGSGRDKTISYTSFAANWLDAAFVAEAGNGAVLQTSGSVVPSLQYKKWWMAGALGLLVCIALLCFKGLPGGLLLPVFLMGITKLCGLTISMLLLAYEVDAKNSLVNQFCSTATKQGCGAVLAGSGASIGGIKWSEVGSFYFAASFLWLFFPGLPYAAKGSWLALAATAVSPYILYSLYYQRYIAQQWCRLCLLAQAVLLAELLLALAFYWRNPVMPATDITTAIVFAVCCLLPPLAWGIGKPALKKVAQWPLYRNGYYRLLHDPDNFAQLLAKQPMAPDGWQQLGILLGNPQAKDTIIKMCNPYCGPCSKAHAQLEKILVANPQVSLRIIFTATAQVDDKRNKPVSHLLALAQKGDGVLTQTALHGWYSAPIKDYEAFAVQFPLGSNTQPQQMHIALMREWCQQTGAIATPTFYLNGRKLPPGYGINELEHIL
jgi:uncharacterized membrane protein